MFKLNNWYIRLLVSYFPILVLTVSMIIFLSFIAVGEVSRSETAKADRITTGYVVDSVERTVRDAEFKVLEEVAANANYNAYLSGSSATSVKYGVVHSLRALVEENDYIESVYLIRQSDDTVLTASGQIELPAFGDRAFIEEAKDNRNYQGWSASREFREFDSLEPVKIITMHKQTPLPFGKDGLLVINIDLYAVEKLIGGMTNHQVSFMRITDSAGQFVYSGNAGAEADSGEVLTKVQSQVLGWTFESGIQAGQLMGWVSVVSYVWVVIAILTFVIAIVYIIWVTRRNYKPIQLMMNRIQALQLRGSDGGAVRMDDLTMIDRALENLIVQSRDYEKEQRESAILQRRQLFNELLSGQRNHSVNERMSLLNLLPSEGRYAAMVVKLNRYEDFLAEYTLHEQNVLKFALGNVMQELAQNEGLQGFGEWSGPDRITFVFASSDATDERMVERLRQTAAVARKWVGEHLRFLLSIGIGTIVEDWSQIGQSYRDALSGMEYRFSIGRGAVTFSGDIPQDKPNGLFNYMQSCTDCVQEFRLTNEGWRDTFVQLFEKLESDSLKDEDIHSLLQFFLQTLGRELKHLSDELNECLEGDRVSMLLVKLKEASSLTELKEPLLPYLDEIFEMYTGLSQAKGYKTMIAEIRAYIQENYADPDLSLKHLSDRFQISGKYASYLFKLEYDMKFVDFLVQLRMQQAERLLAETEETVQNIALQVGYANSITFGRVFKRTTGVTPGEFRKLKMRPSSSDWGTQGNREEAVTDA
ncbi:helix-turn-helix domain-containing protein [Paenibacillus soyae]|uniref:Helix-turn-helix domain-containing protein n=1 Tax=Paenibacillus soyae TaxID=2969249 RepID=A0A9X2SBH0_9BACL|nr:helix-turn-helix domain-containing protein [Paenibacillus soyae]MCR2807679.1 helix-turn-helix domain-containing protein [Paenibacillus soyae]